MIRKIRETDRETFLKMTDIFYSSPAVMANISQKYHEDFFEEMMETSTYAEGFMIEYENNIAGYGVISKTYSHEAGGMVIWLEELFILQEYRQKGLGKEFFRFLEENYAYAKRFRLEAEGDNEKAIELYKRLGYKELPYIQLYKE